MATALSDSGVNPLAMPPAVDYPLAAPRRLRQCLALAWLLVVGVHAYWLTVAPAGDWRPWAGVLVALLAAAWAWRTGPLVQSGALVWDGDAWYREHPAGSETGQVLVRLDAQSGLLLQFVSDSGSTRWLWLEQSTRPGHWLGLRRAVFAAPPRRAAAAHGSGDRAVLP